MRIFEELGFTKFYSKNNNAYVTYVTYDVTYAVPYFSNNELVNIIETLISYGYINGEEKTKYENMIGGDFSKQEKKWLSISVDPNPNGYHQLMRYDSITFNKMWTNEISDSDLGKGLMKAKAIKNLSGVGSENNTGGTREALDMKYMRFIPLEALAAAAASFEYGAKKYKTRNWEKGLPWQQMIDSTRRHLDDFERGENVDESGLAQVDMLMASCMMLVASVLRGIGEDNRISLVDDKAWTGKECAKYITEQVNKGKYNVKD